MEQIGQTQPTLGSSRVNHEIALGQGGVSIRRPERQDCCNNGIHACPGEFNRVSDGDYCPPLGHPRKERSTVRFRCGAIASTRTCCLLGASRHQETRVPRTPRGRFTSVTGPGGGDEPIDDGVADAVRRASIAVAAELDLLERTSEPTICTQGSNRFHSRNAAPFGDGSRARRGPVDGPAAIRLLLRV
jgi:hypothetical protein